MEEALVTVLNSLRAVEALFRDALSGTTSNGDTSTSADDEMPILSTLTGNSTSESSLSVDVTL